ncbi:MAG: replication-associated recombination protein A, partial [Parasporobacterium sp.]|nr:replication-associated recombination protein A [Parasporobacterium sp.]
YFEVNGALISRSLIYMLQPLSADDIKEIAKRAVTDKEKGMGAYKPVLEDEALEFIAGYASGDARTALNAIELAVLTTAPSEDGFIHITSDILGDCIQKRNLRYDKDGDNHYDTISAFIKSMRGSDPDAAVYYLARMIYAGEDVNFIARRIMICAAEDVGNADPRALQVAVAAQQAVHLLGLPEARIPLAQAVIYIACAPKSNSAINAIDAALKKVEETDVKTVPAHLKDSHYGGAKKLGHGLDYKYAHLFPEHYVKQQYLPDELVGEVFYEPGNLGYEKTMKERLERLRARDK